MQLVLSPRPPWSGSICVSRLASLVAWHSVRGTVLPILHIQAKDTFSVDPLISPPNLFILRDCSRAFKHRPLGLPWWPNG